MDFPQLLPLHFHTIERLIAQTLTTPFQECLVRFWCCWEALEEARLWQMQSSILWDSES